MQLSHLIEEEESAFEVVKAPSSRRFLKPISLVAGAALLVCAGYAAGSHKALVRGAAGDGLVSEVLLTATDFSAYYKKNIQGLTCSEVLRSNVNIMTTATTPATGLNQAQQINMWNWLNANAGEAAVTSAAHKAMQEGANQCSALPPPTPAKSAPVPVGSSISSYTEFGDMYSHQTAGKPWTEITKIDALVRERSSSLPLTVSAAVETLNDWYRHHATPAERKHFDDDAVAHINMGSR